MIYGWRLLRSCLRVANGPLPLTWSGSFFPAWLILPGCGDSAHSSRPMAVLALAHCARSSILIYPSLTAFFTFALWLIFFR